MYGHKVWAIPTICEVMKRGRESERDGRSKKVALLGFHEKTQIVHQDLKFRVFILWVNNY